MCSPSVCGGGEQFINIMTMNSIPELTTEQIYLGYRHCWWFNFAIPRYQATFSFADGLKLVSYSTALTDNIQQARYLGIGRDSNQIYDPNHFPDTIQKGAVKQDGPMQLSEARVIKSLRPALKRNRKSHQPRRCRIFRILKKSIEVRKCSKKLRTMWLSHMHKRYGWMLLA